jgi:iron(III) transport system permease protein
LIRRVGSDGQKEGVTGQNACCFLMDSITTKIEKVFRLLILTVAGALLALPAVGALLPLLTMPPDAARELSFTGRQLWLLARSLLFSGVAAGAATVLGIAVVVPLMGSKMRYLLAFVLTPLVLIPPSIHGLNWATTVLVADGWLRRVGGFTSLAAGWGAAMVVQVLAFLPLAVAVAWAGFAALDAKLVEAGVVFRSAPAVVAGIAIRLAGPVLGAGAGIMFLLSLSDYSVPSLFSVNVYALEIFSSYSSGSHPSVALLTAAPLVGVIAATLIAGLRIGRRAQSMALSRRATSAAEGGMRAPAGLVSVAAAVLLIQLFVPLASMASVAGSWKSIAAAYTGARSEIAVSIALSSVVSVLSLLIGSEVSRVLDRGGPASIAWWVLTVLAFTLPAPLTGIGVLQIGGRLGLWAENLLPVWANVARFLPIAAFVSYALRRRMDGRLLEAASVFGRSRFSIFWRVTLPLALPGIVVSAAVCFSLTMGELGATLLVAAPGRATLIMRLYNLLHYGASREVAALGLILYGPTLAASALMTVILNRRGTRHSDGGIDA